LWEKRVIGGGWDKIEEIERGFKGFGE